jgi:hypothetical protein
MLLGQTLALKADQLGLVVPHLEAAMLDSQGYPVLMEGRINDVAEFAYYWAHDLHCIVEPLRLSGRLLAFLDEHSRIYPQT